MKVTVVGAGNVGATVANVLAGKNFCSEVMLVDIKKGYAEGKAMDIMQTAHLLNFDTTVTGVTAKIGDEEGYAPTAGSDVVVVTSGMPRKPGMSRDDLLGINLAKLLDMHAGTIQRLQARLQGVDDAAALDDDADVAPLIAFGCHAAGQVVAALEEARARMPGAEIRLPEYVDDAIADIALIFHWPLDTLTALPLPDLITWRERARVRACPDE